MSRKSFNKSAKSPAMWLLASCPIMCVLPQFHFRHHLDNDNKLLFQIKRGNLHFAFFGANKRATLLSMLAALLLQHAAIFTSKTADDSATNSSPCPAATGGSSYQLTPGLVNSVRLSWVLNQSHDASTSPVQLDRLIGVADSRPDWLSWKADSKGVWMISIKPDNAS